ncbi:DUF397 domain-containing protein [Streptomyces griseoviridis]|jgi:hypothetical protein|uniref:DUF397 domain-containing protein n=3 Tax=Streptomyces TaxID=1883 RepID=A0A918GC23_STRGD|nr:MULTISPECIES: DUF397 domain-containing protein [Streptomyces]MDP9682580.1 hypothetical protein [Streptomyces griseoviridis]GGS28465.1 hypothetical protein GCM10010238_16410 [Streptomyces niveoruber]GGS80338.1 hypothetical protein GCM10010240_12030 [Streptomyces griseoviridis]GGU20057.1 hypothetical protein GCM10010259_08210 [Streptomyces daghestanicus]GHI32193.1 hypothetical protein Sdagh_39230 [Streptomyces daghestanicus]
MTSTQWRKSSYSGDSSNCVEIATTPTAVLVRDSKASSGARLAFPRSVWADFLSRSVKDVC